MKIWKVTIGVVVGALVLGVIALAALPSLAQTLATATPAMPTTVAPSVPFKPGFDFHIRGGDGFISATASVTGLTTQEVLTQLQSGQSLAQIAESKGKTADEVIAAARAQLEETLKQAVTDGRITQAQADAKLAQFDQTASQIVNDTTLGQRFGNGHHGFGPGGRGFGPHGGNSLIEATASATGLTVQEVLTQLQSGQSLAQIAESKGKTADEVITAARTQLEETLKQAVTDGRITQAQADAKLAQFDETASQIMNDATLGQRLGAGRGGFGRGDRGFGRHGGNSLLDATASVTGLTTQEVLTQLQSGQSLAQIAESKGKTADEVIAAARTQLEEMLKQAVTDGRITQAQADAKLAAFDQSASQIMSDTTLGQRFDHKPFNPTVPGTPAIPAPTSGNDA
jgi:flagellar hook-basal body complex protein FliE